MPSVLITGTSAGIGQATAVELAKRNWRVFATMRDTGKSARLQDALTAAGVRNRVEIVRLDVNDAASIRDAVTLTLASTGGLLDAVVHNAGVAVGGAFEDVPEAMQRAVMDTNFFGVLALTRAILPTFRGQRRGRIVIVSSDAAFYGQPANAIYTASKCHRRVGRESDVRAEFSARAASEPDLPHRIWEVSPRIAPPAALTRMCKCSAADKHAERQQAPAEVGIA
jgi:NAD(P)-dependent dehydrogenase (short-subunit alcohol dehydrogenase family)